MPDTAASTCVTIGHLEMVLATLKLKDFFSFGQDELNEPHGHWDVFVDVEDTEDFDPADEGDADAFLAWTHQAGDAAFDDEGVLRRALPMIWGGSVAELQTAFARAGLTVRIEQDEEAREPYAESGRLVLSPRSAVVDCDLLAILRAFADLEKQGVVALANAGYTQSDGWTDVAQSATSEATTAVFWHAQKHDSFDGLGNLASLLLLHWRGDANTIITCLRNAGFVVGDAPPEHTCIEVVSGPTAAIEIESFDEASTGQPATAHATTSKRVVTAHAGPLELEHAFRGEDRQPVSRIAFDPRRPQRIAFAQSMDDRGFPSSPAYVVDIEQGRVERALLPATRVMGVGGMRFLHDGRLVFCTTQLRSEKDSEFKGSCLVLHVWSPEQAAEDEILVQAFSHIDDRSLLSFDDDERWAVIGQPDGADVYAVPQRGERWPAPQRLRIPDEPTRAYTRSVMSPDGKHIAWCDDWSAPLACFDRQEGVVVWRHAPHNEHRSDIAFSPDSSVVAVQVGRRDSESRRVAFFAVDDGEPRHEVLSAGTAGSRCFAFHPAGGCLAIGREAGIVSLLTYPEGKLIADVKVLAKGYVSGLEVSQRGDHLVVGGSKGDCALFRISSGQLVASTSSSSSASADPKPTSYLAAKGAHPLVGATGRLIAGGWSGHAATVKLVGAGGDKLRVTIDMFGRAMDVDVDAKAFRAASDLGQVTDASPYRAGDIVFVHDSYFERGNVVEVQHVEEATARLFVTRIPGADDELEDNEELDEEDKWQMMDFDEVTLVRPLRRDPLVDYLAAIEGVRFRFGHLQALSIWCMRQLEAVDWNVDDPSLAADGALASELAALEQQVHAECAREHELRTLRFRERFEPLSHEERVERWKAEWASWVDWRPSVQALPPELAQLYDDDEKRHAVMTLRERFEKLSTR